MISIDVGKLEYYDGSKNQFVYEEGGVVEFEYSLKVIYDWEAKYHKPFLKGKHTYWETLDFYTMMALKPINSQFINDEVMERLSKYISDSNTATVFTTADEGQNANNPFTKGKVYTAEELYTYMFANNIPLEFENRNFNRLLVMLRIISNQSTAPKKMSKQDILKQNAELNRKRREELKTKG